MKKLVILILISLLVTQIAFSQNVGIGTNLPTAKLTVNGNLALLSDTVKLSCDLISSRIVINNLAKPKSIFHIINTACAFVASPVISGLSGGTDGKIVIIISHVNGMQILHLQGANGIVTVADSLNMIELYENNNTGNINQPSSINFNNGGSITLIYDGNRKRWKPVSFYGEYKTESFGWLRASNFNDIYNPNGGNIGVGTASPIAKLHVGGGVKIEDSINIGGQIRITGGNPAAGKVLTSDLNGIASWSAPAAVVHYIGENYGGGIVFYVYDNGQHGLITAGTDQSTGIKWTSVSGIGYRDGIGAGIFNTERIIILAQSIAEYAAKICAYYQGGDFGDWYLPSKYELNLLYLQKNLIGGFAGAYYWSSNESPGGFGAWSQNFINGDQVASAKANTYYVRAVRGF
ncbi:hypothetical protein BH10BAC3_BH10BAC3_24630 [soil metagenome]